MSLVGFDETIPEAAYLYPPLTTVRQDFAALGELMMQKVLLALEEDEPATSTPTASARARRRRKGRAWLAVARGTAHHAPDRCPGRFDRRRTTHQRSWIESRSRRSYSSVTAAVKSSPSGGTELRWRLPACSGERAPRDHRGDTVQLGDPGQGCAGG